LPTFIDTENAWQEALPALRESTALALDTETDSFFAYRPKICLLQITVEGGDYILDPLADFALDALGEILADEKREVILHAAENDVIHMQHEFGWRIARLFDTQVTSFILGTPPYSLAGVLETRFDVKLDKRMQRSDWSRRPLSNEQIEYAANDTRYLLPLASELKERAAEVGRIAEIEAECARIAGRSWTPEPFDPDGFRRMNGAKDLDDMGLSILSALYLFRHELADKRNRAPYRIVADHALVAIARKRATHRIDGTPESFWRRYGKQVGDVVRKAKTQRAPARPKRKAQNGAPLPPEVKARYDALRKWRGSAAEERGVEPFVVARNDLLMEVAKCGPDDAEKMAATMEPFRFREYGEAMRAAMRSGDI